MALSKPVVGALHDHIIGAGFQLALTFDWRIASSAVKFRMPELKNGLACVVGAVLLKHLSNPLIAQGIIYGCHVIEAEHAKKLHLVNDVVDPEKLLEVAVEKAQALGKYPQQTFAMTKHAMNKALIAELRNGKFYCGT